MTETKVRHPETGEAADVAEMVITDAEGRGKEVLALNLGSRPIYRKNWEVALALVGCTAETSGAAQWLKPWSCVIEPLAGHQQLPWNTKVTMGGVDITASVYDKATGQVSIPNVTGDIAIEAEAVMMPSEYEPVEYIRNITRAANNGKYNYFDPGVLATETTEIEYDCMLLDVVNNGAVFGTEGMTASPAFTLVQRQGGAGYGKAWWGNNGYGGSGVTSMWLYPTKDIRQKIRMGKGTLTLRRADGEYATYNMASTLDTPWENPRDLHLGGCQQSANAYRATNQHIYGCKIWQDDVLIRQYIPARRKSDRFVGLYNLLDQTFLTQKTTTGADRCSWIGPYVIPTLNLTDCTISYVSGYEDRMETTTPEIGGTFVYKISPSSGYTFVGGTTPQVEIDGVDVTSQVVTDNGDGTYNVTIANVEDKPIEITAVAVSDGTANATNSVTPMGGNTEEEEM